MKTLLILTPEFNVNLQTNEMFDKNKITHKLFNKDENINIKFRGNENKESKKINLSRVSLYDHSIFIDKIPHCILQSFRRESFDDYPELLALVGLKPETIICNNCHGSGDRPYARGNHSSVFKLRVCGTCRGSGRIKNNN